MRSISLIKQNVKEAVLLLYAAVVMSCPDKCGGLVLYVAVSVLYVAVLKAA